MGTFKQGNRGQAVLSVTQVQDIRALAKDGVTHGELCRRYGVSVGTIGRVVRRETWQKIPDLETSSRALERAADASYEKLQKMLAQTNAPKPDTEIDALKEGLEAPQTNPLDEE